MKLSEYRRLYDAHGASFALYHWRKRRHASAQELREILTLQLSFEYLYPLRKEPPWPTSSARATSTAQP